MFRTVARRTAQATLGLLLATAAMGIAGTAHADEAGANDFASDLTVTGDLNGPITDATATCHAFGNGAYSFELTGQLDGAPILLTFNTNNFQGAHTYNATGVTDDDGGLVTLQTEEIKVVTNGATTGTFTIDEGELVTGSIDTDLADNDQHAHISGTWACNPA